MKQQSKNNVNCIFILPATKQVIFLYAKIEWGCLDMSPLMKKPTKWIVHPALGILPVWSSLRCPHEESLGP